MAHFACMTNSGHAALQKPSLLAGEVELQEQLDSKVVITVVTPALMSPAHLEAVIHNINFQAPEHRALCLCKQEPDSLNNLADFGNCRIKPLFALGSAKVIIQVPSINTHVAVELHVFDFA